MNTIRQTLSRFRARRLLMTLGVVSLCLRALIPMGYMPGNLLAGEFMVLCPVGVPASVAKLIHNGHVDHDQPVLDADRSCPIGSAIQQAWLPTSLVSFSLDFAAIAVERRDDYRSIPAAFVPRYRTRAPPLG